MDYSYARNFSNLRVLVIDSNPFMVRLLASMLDGLGVRSVRTSRGAGEAVSVLSEHPIDVVLCDWLIEPFGAVEFVATVRRRDGSHNPFVPIVMFSASTDIEQVHEARDAGTTEMFALPVATRTLYDRLLHVVQHPRPFIETATFFGPDRRRKEDADYDGLERRIAQPELTMLDAGEAGAAA